jgi:hypothetical protein
MRRPATGAVLLTTMLLAGACGSNGTTGEPAPAAPSSATSSPTSSPTSAVLTCTNAAVPLVRAVEEGITASGGGSLTDAQVVTVPKDQRSTTGWPVAILAANIAAKDGSGPKALGSWAIGEAPSYSPIIALNPGAQALTSWGSAATPGSKAGEARDHVAGLDATKTAEKCVSV